MATRLDEYFYQLSYRLGPGHEAKVAQYIGGLRKTGAAGLSAGKDLERYSRSSERASRVSGLLGRGLQRLVVAFGGLLILRKVSSLLMGFETRMAEVATIAGGSSAKVKALSNDILALSRRVPQTANELGAGAYQILSAQITDTADVLKVLEASSKAAVAGLSDTETAVDAVTTVLNSFQLGAGEAQRVADILFRTVELGKLRFGDIAQNIGTASTSAALAGVTIEELTAAIAAMTQRGINAAEATSSLNRLFLTLVQQTDEQREKFAELGVSFDLATVKEKGFAGLLEELNKLTDGQLEQLGELFPNIRAARSAFVLAGGGLQQYLGFLEKTNDATGAADRAYKILADTTENKIKVAINNLSAALIDLGTRVLPIVTSAIQDVVDAFDFWSGRSRQMIEDAETRTLQFAAKTLSAIGNTRAEIEENIRILKAAIATETDETLRAQFERDLQSFERKLELGKSVQQQLRAEIRDLLGREITDPRLLGKFQELNEAQQVALRDALEALIDFGDVSDAELNRIIGRYAELKGLTAGVKEDVEDTTETIAQPTGGPGRGKPDLTDEQIELQEELARRVREITKSAAEQQLLIIDELEAAYKKAFDGIEASAAADFELLRDHARAALRKEDAEQLADGYRAAIEEGLAKINFDAIGIADEQERQRFILTEQQSLFASLFSAAQQRLVLAENTTEEEQALRDVLAQIVRLMREAAEGQGKVTDDTDKQFQKLQTTLSLIRQSVDGALDLAQAFGLVNEETTKTIRSLEQIGEGVATLAASIPTGNIPGIIAGGLSILGGLGGLFGGGQVSPWGQAIQENTKAMYLLSDRMDEFAQRLADEMDELQLAVDVLAKAQKTKWAGGEYFGGVRLTPEEFLKVYRAAEAVGYQLPENLVAAAARGEDVILWGKLLKDLEELLNTVLAERGAVEEAGRTQAVLRSVAITELQANKLLAYQATQVTVLEQIRDILAGRALVTPPPVSGAPATVTGGITIATNIDHITVGAGATPAQAREVSTALVDELRRGLGEALKDQQRLLGIPS